MGRESNISKEKKAAKQLKKVVQTSVQGDTVAQLCLECYTIDKLLKSVPSGAKIELVRWSYNKYPKRIKLSLEKKMIAKGVRYARQSEPRIQISGELKDVSISGAKNTLQEIAEHYGITLEQMYAQKAILAFGEAKAIFEYSTKEIRNSADLRKKTKVLGLVAVSRDPELQKIAMQKIGEMNPSHFQCKYVVEEKKAVVCSSLD